MTLFERTKEMSKKRGLALTDVSVKAGLGSRAVYKWKENDPSTDRVQAVADVLGVSVDYLLGNTDDPMPKRAKHEPVDLYEVDDSERDRLVSANGQHISDDDWAIIKAVLAKYPKKGQ